MDYNVIVTSYRNELRQLKSALRELGKFRRTPFRDVMTGLVTDVYSFMDSLLNDPPLSLARVMIIDEVIPLTNPDELLNDLKKVVKDLKIKGKFRVTVERRGWKGEINSYELAKSLGAFIHETKGNEVSLDDPDTELVITIMSNTCGVTLLRKELKEKYYFLKAKK